MPVGVYAHKSSQGFQKGNRLGVGGKGNPLAYKNRKKMGYIMPEEVRKKISESMKGKKNSLGVKLSDAQRISRGFLTKKEKNKNHNRRAYLRKYNCTEEDFNIIFLSQNGECAICKTHQSQMKKSLSLDHCHTTNKVRGLLCQKCNFMLGLAKDSIDILKNSLIYLAKEDQKHKEAYAVN